MSEPIEVVKIAYRVPVSNEMLALAEDARQAYAEFMALSPDERAERIRAGAVARTARHAELLAAAQDVAARIRDAAGVFAEIVDEHPPMVGLDSDTYQDAAVCRTCAVTDQDGDIEGEPYPCRTLRIVARVLGG